ncbi:MAG: hypothetical protein ACJASN_001985 [Cyclobacteriaceae bacterium]
MNSSYLLLWNYLGVGYVFQNNWYRNSYYIIKDQKSLDIKVNQGIMDSKKLLLNNRQEQVRKGLLINNDDIAQDDRFQKFEKMALSPYAFFRGSNHLYWEDIYNDWRISFFGGVEETLTWINGDAHVYNYGAYANHYGQAIFCMDDFDDSIVADYQFDLWRMAISIVLDCRDKGVFNAVQQHKALQVFSEAYLEEMRNHKRDDPSYEVHMTKQTADGLLGDFLTKVERKRSRAKMLRKWTKVVDEVRKFDADSKKLELLPKRQYKKIEQSILRYQQEVASILSVEPSHFQIKDIIRRVKAGTGSLGCDRYYVLLEGDTNSQEDDIILDVKEQGRPPLYAHMNEKEQAEYRTAFPNEGMRHASAYQALAEHPDRYLGWVSIDEIVFSIRERSPFKSDFPTEKLLQEQDLYFMSNAWGSILAARHKRASYKLNDQANLMPNYFAEQLAGREEQFVQLVTSVAFQYADCVAQDYQYLLRMIQD